VVAGSSRGTGMAGMGAVDSMAVWLVVAEVVGRAVAVSESVAVVEVAGMGTVGRVVGVAVVGTYIFATS